MTSISGMFDGEQHMFDPADGYFPDTGATLVIDGWEEDEEEDILSPFESATLIPVLRDTGRPSARQDELFPHRHLEQAWGSLSITLTALSYILDISKKQYQHVNHENGTMGWSFQLEEFLTERL